MTDEQVTTTEIIEPASTENAESTPQGADTDSTDWKAMARKWEDRAKKSDKELSVLKKHSESSDKSVQSLTSENQELKNQLNKIVLCGKLGFGVT
ncbi:hypothetical protein [Alloscardovia criceti]|uniref:hypothetical protein n=1 Tax=Alloscardovia criceti TaxID=356828 RepID=UPI00036F75F7|nr:hypothetical protein [Alloscardovia criceti]